MANQAKRILESNGQGIDTQSAQHYRKPLGKLTRADLKDLCESSIEGWTKHNAPRMGAALAFYTLLSLMPLLLVAISIAGLIYGPEAAQSGVMGPIRFVIGLQRMRIVQALLEGTKSRADGVLATVFGTLILMFGATGVLTELRDALNVIWGVPTRRLSTIEGILSLVKARLWGLGAVVTIVIFLAGSLAFNTWISALGAMASVLPGHEFLLHLLNSVASFVAVAILFGAVYKVVPAVPIEWPDVILGALVTSLLFTIGNLLLGLYLGRASFSSTYGAASSTIMFALWVYYSSQIFFLGAEFTKAFAECFGSAPKTGPSRQSGSNRRNRADW